MFKINSSVYFNACYLLKFIFFCFNVQCSKFVFYRIKTWPIYFYFQCSMFKISFTLSPWTRFRVWIALRCLKFIFFCLFFSLKCNIFLFVHFSFFFPQAPEWKERETEPKRKKLRLNYFVNFLTTLLKLILQKTVRIYLK